MSEAFDQAFSELVNIEGKFTDDPDDAGNWTTGIIGQGELRGTKYGISAASYPHLDIKSITLDEAKAIYRRDYWDIWANFRGLSYPFPLTFLKELFDAGVNAGVGNAKRFLQRAINVVDDGSIGNTTIGELDKALKEHGIARVEQWFLAEKLLHYTRLKSWDKYGRGWARRVAANLKSV